MKTRVLATSLLALSGAMIMGGCVYREKTVPAASPATTVVVAPSANDRVVRYPEGRYELAQEVLPVDALKFKDSKKYPERLKDALVRTSVFFLHATALFALMPLVAKRFGEGGAGTYSDGKLYTRSKKRGDVQRILEILVAHGAKDDILFEDDEDDLGTSLEDACRTVVEVRQKRHRLEGRDDGKAARSGEGCAGGYP